MEFSREYMSYFSNDQNEKNKDILDELFIISKHDIIVKRVLEFYQHELQYSYPQLLENLNEILLSITKGLLDKSNSLERSLNKVIQQSEKPIWFE